MPFEPRIAEAQLALDRISTVEVPRLAWDTMEAGLDGLAIRWLAALDLPTFFKFKKYCPQQ